MRPSISRDGQQLDMRCSMQTYHRPNQRTRPSPHTRELLLISRPDEGRRLSWPKPIVDVLLTTVTVMVVNWQAVMHHVKLCVCSVLIVWSVERVTRSNSCN